MARESKPLEKAFDEINEIIEKMEDADISLNDSFSLYQKGIQLLKYCNDSLDKVEKKIVILNEGEEDE
jgi:exodeoxyribonuclease VII small subunit